MEKEPLFINDKYTECANHLDQEFLKLVNAFFDEHKERFSLRELEYLCKATITDVALTNLLGI